MADWFQQQALSGSLLLAVPVALVAGLVSFFSPCVIPLLPGYLSYATGLSGADLGSARRGRMLAGSLLFVAGFTVVFVILGYAAGDGRRLAGRVAPDAVLHPRRAAHRARAGLRRVASVHPARVAGALGCRRWGSSAAPVIGFLFGLGWTPCLGPTLVAITALSLNEATAERGALLSAIYAFGLGIPFVVAALLYRRALGAFAWVRRHQVWVMRLGGLMLVAVGVLLVSGWWDDMVTWLQIHLITTTETSL